MKNDYQPRRLGSKTIFITIITLIALTALAVALNLPLLRQAFGFIFLTFIPGFLLLSVLKLNRLGLTEKTVLSVGLSIAVLMLLGLVLNSLLPAVGYTQPLSTISLLISFSTATIILAIAAYIRNKAITFSLSDFKLTIGEKAFLIVPALFPLIGIVGIRIMNLSDNNMLLMVLLFLIAANVIFLSFLNRRVSEKVYPATILLTSISLLLIYSLRSNHIIGSDTHREYFIFLTTLDNLRWGELGFGTLDTSLSISLLPTIYQVFLKINPEYLFKLLPSLIVSFSPLVVYLLGKKYIGGFYAFLASVFLMSQIVFLWTPSYARINIAILFFSLALLSLFNDNISELGKRTLFTIFTASLIISHYGATYVAFFALLLTWSGMQILSSIASRKKELATALKGTQAKLSQGITITTIVLFLAMLFFWYSQMTETTFATGVVFVYYTFARWAWFLDVGVSDQAVQAAFGTVFPYAGVAQRIEFVFSWLTIILLSIGLLGTIVRFKALVPAADFRQKRFETEYLMLSMACYSLLVATVLLPYISRNYGAGRTYFQMMFPLAIFFVVGGIELARYLKARPYWIILAVLIPYFLSTSGATTQVFGFPRAITLNSTGILYERLYISDEESYAAKWLKEHAKTGTAIYAHYFAQDLLISQGKIPSRQINPDLITEYEAGKMIDGYIYLRYVDIADGGLLTKYSALFTRKNRIYANPRSHVYR